MCGRIVASTPVSVIAAQFLAAEVTAADDNHREDSPDDDKPGDDDRPRYNVAPTDPVHAVASTRGVRRLGALSWGLVPSWSAGPSHRRLVNVRSETVAERPRFRRLLQGRRCIVPADGFYEWKQVGSGRAKAPFFVRRREEGQLLALAGLWDVWRPEDGSERGPRPLRTCTILTTRPNELVAELHDRMPVILPPDTWELWLDPEVTDVDALTSVLGPCPAEVLQCWPVSTAVNSVRNDGPELIEPVDPMDPVSPIGPPARLELLDPTGRVQPSRP